MTRDNNNKLKQQSTSNFVKENTLGIPEEILRVHLFKRYGQQPVDTEHDKPSSLTHIDAEPLLKKLCQDEREDAREPAHRSGVLHREALKLKSVPPPIVYSWKLEETREKS